MSSFYEYETHSSLVTNEDLTFSGLEQKLFQSIPIIEETMDWYDHVACIFLLNDNPSVALQQAQFIVSTFEDKSNNSWRRLVSSQFINFTNQDKDISTIRFTEVLHILQHHKLLNILGVAIKTIVAVDSFRLKLFYIIDALSKTCAAELIRCMNSDNVKPNSMHLCLEMHFLEWIKNGDISPKDCSKLDRSLAYVRNVFEVSLFKTVNCNSETVDSVNGDTSITCDTNISASTASSNLMNLIEEGPSKIKISHGLCIIINQENFYFDYSLPSEILKYAAKEQLKFRSGSHFDRDNLNETFQLLSCDTKIYENLNRQQLFSTFMEISQRNLTTYDALVVCILSHGERNSIYTADCIPISLDTIKTFFDGQHCPTLLNKPKMFFLQACQGDATQTIVRDVYEEDGIKNNLPAVSNFFEAWATVPGYFSFRSPYKGSVFIGALCRVFQTCGHKESLLDLMTMVNNEVSKWVSKDFKKQMSCCTYSLLQGIQFQRREDFKS